MLDLLTIYPQISRKKNSSPIFDRSPNFKRAHVLITLIRPHNIYDTMIHSFHTFHFTSILFVYYVNRFPWKIDYTNVMNLPPPPPPTSNSQDNSMHIAMGGTSYGDHSNQDSMAPYNFKPTVRFNDVVQYHEYSTVQPLFTPASANPSSATMSSR